MQLTPNAGLVQSAVTFGSSTVQLAAVNAMDDITEARWTLGEGMPRGSSASRCRVSTFDGTPATNHELVGNS